MRQAGAMEGVELRRVVEPTSDADDFAASVERDLANLPTTEDEYRR